LIIKTIPVFNPDLRYMRAAQGLLIRAAWQPFQKIDD
jgi:hypothetical protein